MLDGIRKFVAALRGSNQVMPYYFRSGWDLNSRESHVAGIAIGSTSQFNSSPSSADDKQMDMRLEKKPVEVWQELNGEEPKMNLANLDGQIKMVKRRQKVLRELGSNSSDEDEALEFLSARKRGLKAKTDFGWAITTLGQVSELVQKYKLAYVNFESYAKTIPMEAIDELEKFMKEYEKVSPGTKPVLKLIIDDIPEKAPDGKVKGDSIERKKDPILLASSPFGRFFYILGAWDKEVEIVDDLIYHGK